MLLWKESFPSIDESSIKDSDSEPWKTWPRPPAGFIDFGCVSIPTARSRFKKQNGRCGNGLLTHILTSEGYTGIGIDLRARNSWEHYPSSTRAALKVHAFDPISSSRPPAYFKPGAFIIGNHADELTPWIPVVSTLYEASGYLSIPCCSWAFDAKYDRSTAANYPIPNDDFANSLNLGGDGTHKSSYSMYRIWLASISLHCGWEVECEMLRIPSTRNWAIVGEHGSPFVFSKNFIEVLSRQKTCRIMP